MIIVTIYNKKGKAFETDGMYCKRCLEESSSSDGGDAQELTTPIHQATKQPEETEVLPSSALMSEDQLTTPLLEENGMEQSTTDQLNLENKEKTSSSSIIGALTWLNWKLMYKNWKLFVLPLVALVGWCLYIFLVGKFVLPAMICPDGRYAYLLLRLRTSHNVVFNSSVTVLITTNLLFITPRRICMYSKVGMSLLSIYM